MTFANPYLLLLLLLLIPLIAWYISNRHKQQVTLQVSNSYSFKQLPPTWKNRLKHVPFILRLLVIILIIVVLARPQSTNSWKNVSTEGIDIMITLDISSSMLAEDLKPNRLEAAKGVASKFIAGRPDDNIGLVLFSAESFTQCPLTTDHRVVLNLLSQVKSGIIEDGTAIGLGLANAVNRIKDAPAKSKVIILLTDGSNNRGDIDPITAAELAKEYGIRVYTIGVGTRGKAPYPFQTAYGIQYQNIDVVIDEEPLKKIAGITGGEYYRATDNRSLSQIYAQIDQLEKTRFHVKEVSRKTEEYRMFGLAAFILLVIELILRHIVLRRLP
jgi:Ca-activated chloride channel family protein